MTEFPDHPFWDFSLSVYMSDGVGAACLELQTTHELDVNILLFCLWFGASGRGSLNADQIAAAIEAVDAWHQEVVRALRAVRVRMKGGVTEAPSALTESLRQRIQKTEIDCEHAEQLMLAEAVDELSDEGRIVEDRLTDAVSNISAYFATFGAISETCRPHLRHIIGVAFGDCASDTLDTAAARL